MTYIRICALAACVCLVLLLFGRRQEEMSVLILLFLYIGLWTYGLPALEHITLQVRQAADGVSALHPEILVKCGGVLAVCGIASAIGNAAGKKEIGEILDFLAALEMLLLCRPLFADLIGAAKEILK